MKPFFTYYGGKWRAARHYPAPNHAVVVEPFAGSAGYSVFYNVRKAILIDKSEYIVGVWDFLIHATEREILALPDLEPDQRVEDRSHIARVPLLELE